MPTDAEIEAAAKVLQKRDWGEYSNPDDLPAYMDDAEAALEAADKVREERADDELLAAAEVIRAKKEARTQPCEGCDSREEWCGRKPCPNFHGEPEPGNTGITPDRGFAGKPETGQPNPDPPGKAYRVGLEVGALDERRRIVALIEGLKIHEIDESSEREVSYNFALTSILKAIQEVDDE